MAFDILLAKRVREYLEGIPGLKVEEKKMFGGLAFLINGKMCINVSGQNLMCRFDPALTPALAVKTGFQPMIMRDKEYPGFCFVQPAGVEKKTDFQFWLNLCLDFNHEAKISKKRKKN